MPLSIQANLADVGSVIDWGLVRGSGGGRWGTVSGFTYQPPLAAVKGAIGGIHPSALSPL